MKRLFYTWILAACGLVGAGCSEKGDDIKSPHKQYLTEFTAEAGDVTRAAVGLADGKVAWEDGDAVMVSNGETTAEFIYDASKGKFIVAEGELAATGSYNAVYPASIYTGETDGIISVNLPAEQTYGEDIVRNAPMSAVSTTSHFVFKNLCGILKLKLDGDKSVVKIVFTAEAGVAGAATVADNALTMGADAAKSLTLDCAAGIALGGGKSFAVVIPAQTYTGGFALDVHFSDGTVFTKSTALDRTVAANRIDAMAAFKTYYFSGGKGTETEPYLIATAEDVAELSALSNGSDGDEFNAACYRQTADIDLAGVAYTPIAAGAMFSGVYDGGGYVFENLTIADYAVNNCGLVGNLSGTVKNVVMKNVSVTSTANHIAAVAGLMNGENARIENCSVNGSVRGVEQVGMIVGILQRGVVSGCESAGKVAGTARLGGLVGHIADDYEKIIDGCISRADVEGTGNNCGGIVGSIAPTDTYTAADDNTCVLVINTMYLGGSVVTSGKQVGGVAGCLQGSKYAGVKLCVVNCAVNPALLQSVSYQNLGGISGYTRYGTAQNVYTTPTDGDKFRYDDTPAAGKGAGGIFGGRKTSITCIDGYYAALVYCKDADSKVKALQMTVDQMKSTSYGFALPSDDTVQCTSLLDALNKGAAKYNAAPLVEGYEAKEWIADPETGLPVVKL